MKAGRLLNLLCLQSEYLGHKNHYNQNEKLGMYGAKDGHSGMIVEFTAMPIKKFLNNYPFFHFCYIFIFYALFQWSILLKNV